jgi:hypothetical protein
VKSAVILLSQPSSTGDIRVGEQALAVVKLDDIPLAKSRP